VDDRHPLNTVRKELLVCKIYVLGPNFLVSEFRYRHKISTIHLGQINTIVGFLMGIRACLGLHLKNRVFKSKRVFGKSFILKLLPKVIFGSFFSFLKP
jgi:hypothetical protein